MNAFDVLLPKCRHGRPTRESCADCIRETEAARRQAEHTSTPLVTKLERANVKLVADPLNLPPLGPHVASVSHVRGKFIVTCGCGVGFRIKGDREEVESAWGRHRGVLL